MKVVGTISGTSMDALDFVLCDIGEKKLRFLDLKSKKIPVKLRDRLQRAAKHELKVDALSLLHYEWGEFIAKSLKAITEKHHWKYKLVGSHGQTVFHQGKKASLQIGEASYIKEICKVDVVSDFRAADIAARGEAAPFAPLLHEKLSCEKNIAFHNLGGISNLTYLGKSNIAFDTGPANMPIDLCMQRLTSKPYDKGGAFARKGLADMKLVLKMLEHPFLQKKPLKSCGREEFGEVFLKQHQAGLKKLSPQDQIASLTEFVAISIAEAYKNFLPEPPEKIYCCGGGANNQRLMEKLSYYLPHSKLTTVRDLGWDPFAIEGACFAYLAYQRINNQKLNVKAYTGVDHKITLGKII